ncbi:hypothetical protein IWQ57_002530, partial [Coemansia nantahalensis]
MADMRSLVEDWHTLLPLLAVCSRWRRICAPKVYSQGFVDGRSLGASGPRSCCYSNLELCASLRYMRHLRSLRFETGPTRATLMYLAQIEARHQRADWSRIRSLTLCQFGHRPQAMLGIDRAMARELSDFITKRMPRISTIEALIVDGHPSKDSIGSRLVSHYAHRLTNITSLVPLVVDNACFTKLTHLQLHLGGTTRLPLAFRDTLRQLTLSNVPHDLRWDQLIDNAGDGHIEFSSLEHLCISYQNSDDDRGGLSEEHRLQPAAPVTLYFPVLEKLQLAWCTFRCQILGSAVLPSKMKRVYVHSTSSVLPRLMSYDKMQIGSLTVDMETGSADDPQLFLESSNQLFGSHSPAKKARMVITELPEAVDIRSVAWTHLSSLTIRFHLGVTQLFALLCQLPHLQELGVLALDLVQLDLKAAQKAAGRFPRETLRSAAIYPADMAYSRKQYLAFLGFFAT